MPSVGNGQGSDSAKILAIALIFLFCIGLASIGFFILKLSPTVYYYEDGFTLGKNGEKILYKDLKYHFFPGSIPNRVAAIFYKKGDKLKSIKAQSYQTHAFSLFQEDVVKANLPQAIEKIEAGETLEFKAKNPHKSAFTMKNVEKQLEEGISIKINKNSISFDDEVYPWADYTVISEYVGYIVVFDKYTDQKVLSFNNKNMVCQPHIVTNLIHILGGR